ncbi:MAG: hypothetical protein WCD45_00855, partial [Gallionella sp.]
MSDTKTPVAAINRDALNLALVEQGGAFSSALSERHDHLFADVALCISTAELAQMQAVIDAAEAVAQRRNDEMNGDKPAALGVFYGYDFHLNNDGAHLIEINTNAGGAFFNAVLIDSQCETGLPGKALADENLWQSFNAMFRNEWRLARGDAPLNTIAIVDESPQEQYLYPEFLLAKNCLERDGIEVFIVDPADLQARDDGLYVGEVKIDLIYNR